MSIDIKIGADPEFFLKDKATGNPISAHNIVPGTKKEPYRLKKGAIQADGTAVEFNIDPASNADEFADNIRTVLDQVKTFIPKSLEFNMVPAVEYPMPYFKSLPFQAVELGCEPDFNAWSDGSMNKINTKAASSGLRTGAGHIHIGWNEGGYDITDPNFKDDCNHVIKALDNWIGRYSWLWEKENKRTQLYGALGAYRPKSYGCEWCVPSNAWLSHDETLWKWLFTAVKQVVIAQAEATSLAHTPSAHQIYLNPSPGVKCTNISRNDVLYAGKSTLINYNRVMQAIGVPEFPRSALVVEGI